MSNLEIPSDDDVVAALNMLGGGATALQLRDELVGQSHGKSRCELAIQRAVDRGRIFIWRDWTVHLDEEQQFA
jgi:hypothetical protein